MIRASRITNIWSDIRYHGYAPEGSLLTGTSGSVAAGTLLVTGNVDGEHPAGT